MIQKRDTSEDDAVTGDTNDEQQHIDELVGRIEEFLKNEEFGASIQSVADKFGLSRYDARYYLGMLIGAGKVGVKQMGPVKVHYYKRR